MSKLKNLNTIFLKERTCFKQYVQMVIKYSRAQVQLLEGKIQNEIFFFLQERIKVISHMFLFSFRHLKNSKHFDQICQDTKIYNQKLFSM